MNTKIASLNVRGLANKTKREKTFAWLKEQPFSIILLQETHSSIGSNLNWGKEWGNNLFLSGNSTNSKGVAILLKQNSNATLIKHTDISTGCLQALELEINEKNNHINGNFSIFNTIRTMDRIFINRNSIFFSNSSLCSIFWFGRSH